MVVTLTLWQRQSTINCVGKFVCKQSRLTLWFADVTNGISDDPSDFSHSDTYCLVVFLINVLDAFVHSEPIRYFHCAKFIVNDLQRWTV